MTLADKHNRTYIKSMYEGHQHGSAEGFKNFYQAQSL